ncbi:MAG: 2-dehydro-3-deoxy-6-phosphogalactonate aldolase [Albidovulum sp.]|nr:2-dehydro-3-deoxy-6-phosphogalactonate aldolase [Albidovulum sp.]
MSRKVIGILRGIRPDEADDVAAAVLNAGIRRVEVTLDSPGALDSIDELSGKFSGQGEFGAGTVLNERDVEAAAESGASFVVSPDCNLSVIRRTKDLGLSSFPGVFTATECFAALRGGADGLKMFPASLLGLDGMAALRTVLGSAPDLYAVGGVSPENFGEWIAAGADGFGIGSALFKSGLSVDEVGRRARATAIAFDKAISGRNRLN